MYKITRKLVSLFNVFVFLTIASTPAYSKQLTNAPIALSDLGAFETKFSLVDEVSSIAGIPALGYVTYKPSSAFKVSLPFSPQQIVFSKVNGQTVKKGEPVAKISGVEVEHFFEEFETAKQFYAQAKSFIETTKHYASDNTIKREEWLALNKTYQDAFLEFEHLAHVKKQITTDATGNSYLVSPKDGTINLFDGVNGTLFEVIPTESIFVKTAVNSTNVHQLIGFQANDSACRLNADFIERTQFQSKQFVWSKLNVQCSATIGAQFSLVPIYKMSGFSIPKTAVFELNEQNYVATKTDEHLQLQPVNIIGSNDLNYIVQSDNLTKHSKVLFTSVSIVQGIILGLGE